MTIVTRATNILLQPKNEWEVVSDEPSSTGGLYLNYILPLAAIGPIASFLGMSAIGFGPFRMPLQYGLSAAIVSFAMALVSVFVVALVIDGLATHFQGRKSAQQALKLATYSLTPAWLGGILLLVPAMGALALLAGLYGIYLLYLGLPVLMESPRDKALPYTASVVVVAIILQLVLGSVTGVILGATAAPSVAANQVVPEWAGLSPEEQRSLEKLNEIARKMQAEQARQQENSDPAE